jgi:hypothetical protein
MGARWRIGVRPRVLIINSRLSYRLVRIAGSHQEQRLILPILRLGLKDLSWGHIWKLNLTPRDPADDLPETAVSRVQLSASLAHLRGSHSVTPIHSAIATNVRPASSAARYANAFLPRPRDLRFNSSCLM